MRRIGVVTTDFSLYHDLVRALRSRGLPFQSLRLGERPDPSVRVLLTSWRDALEGSFPADLPVVTVAPDREGREDAEGAVEQALRVLEGVEAYHEVAVGIDPGLRPGIALFADGRLLRATQVFVVAETGRAVRRLLDQYPHEAAVIRVGHGAPPERDVIVGDLWALQEEGVRLEIVDEWGTTPGPGRAEYPPDVAAAIQIAQTPGRPPRPRRGPRRG